MRARSVARGEILLEQGSPSRTLFIVNFGLFDVRNSDNTQNVAQIGAGQLIGEIGFFADLPRTAFVIAARDSEVLEISRSAFDELTARFPMLQRAISQSFARRLARLAGIVGGGENAGQRNPLRVTAIIGAGSGGVPQAFIERLRKISIFGDQSCFLTSADAKTHFGTQRPDRYAIANWLCALERNHEHLICVADDNLSNWTQTSLRSADQLFIIADDLPGDLAPIETFASEIFPSTRRHLVRLHAHRSSTVQSTKSWLRRRDVLMVHHVSMEDGEDFNSLARFVTGRAIGFVGGAGAAFGPAHIGILKAFREIGIAFDICGGSSIGAFVAAAFSMLRKPDEIDADIHEIFVRRRAMERRTWPRYGLLDHTVFDHALQEQFGSTRIEDVWRPYFAVATDLSTNEMRVMRTGPIWQAIRASCAVPGALPPFFDEDGHMLVDGGIIDNVPIAAIKSLKAGPNLVIDLRPVSRRIYHVNYQSIPGRWRLLAQMLNPISRKKFPRCPNPARVALMCMFANLHGKTAASSASDLVLRLPPFSGSALANFERHRDVSAAAYRWALKTIDDLRAQGNSAFAAMERLSSSQ